MRPRRNECCARIAQIRSDLLRRAYITCEMVDLILLHSNVVESTEQASRAYADKDAL